MRLDEHMRDLRRYVTSTEDDEAARIKLLRSLQRIDGVRRLPVEPGDVLSKSEIEAVINVATRKRKAHKRKTRKRSEALQKLHFKSLKAMANWFYISAFLIGAMSLLGLFSVIINFGENRNFWKPFFEFLGQLAICATIICQIQTAKHSYLSDNFEEEIELEIERMSGNGT